MFILNEQGDSLEFSAKNLFSVLHSINEPKIAASDRPAEPTQAFICTVKQQGSSELMTHIVLYLANSRLRVAYSWDEGPFEPTGLAHVEEEALDFVENMGFMMDNLNLQKLSEGQRENTLGRFPVFQVLEEVVAETEAIESEPVKEAPLVAAVAADEQSLELDELIEELEPFERLESPPAQAATSASLELSASGSFDEKASLEAMEAEFARDIFESAEEDLDSAVSALGGSASSAPSVPVQVFDTPSKFKTIVRFLASF